MSGRYMYNEPGFFFPGGIFVSFFAVLAIAVALSIDAFAVSFSVAAVLPAVSWRHYFRFSFHFGLFQFIMPVTGWFLGFSVHSFIEEWDHWIAFGLLALVGLNMLRESFFGGEEHEITGDPSRGFSLLVLSVATSIDALAVGMTFAMINVSIWWSATLIGVVCAMITFMGVRLGRIAGDARLLGNRAEVVGALVLIGIGVKILYEHGVF